MVRLLPIRQSDEIEDVCGGQRHDERRQGKRDRDLRREYGEPVGNQQKNSKHDTQRCCHQGDMREHKFHIKAMRVLKQYARGSGKDQDREAYAHAQEPGRLDNTWSARVIMASGTGRYIGQAIADTRALLTVPSDPGNASSAPVGRRTQGERALVRGQTRSDLRRDRRSQTLDGRVTGSSRRGGRRRMCHSKYSFPRSNLFVTSDERNRSCTESAPSHKPLRASKTLGDTGSVSRMSRQVR